MRDAASGLSARSALLCASVWTLVTIAWTLTAAPASALDPLKSISQLTHTAWTAQDGIAGPVRAIAQTTNGYLWLGTEAGLYRFDGIRFTLWEPSTGESLPSSSVWSLCAARDGSLWIGLGSGGISRMRDGRLRSYSPRDGAPAGGLLSIVEDLDGAIWAGGQYGFGKFVAGRWSRIGAATGYPAPGAQSLLVDRRGDLWVATNGSNFGLSHDPIRRNTILTLARHARAFTPTGEAVGMVWSMAEAPNGEVWIADTNAHSVRSIGGESRRRTNIAAGAETMSLLLDGDGGLWIGLIEGGVRRLADSRQPPGPFLDRFQTADGLSGGLVYSALLDREGNAWFGTAGGLDRFRENKVLAFSAREGLDPDQQIALTSGGDGMVWIVSYTRDSVRRWVGGRFVASKLPSFSPHDTARILSLHADRNGRLWLGGSFKLATEIGGRLSYVHAAELEPGANVEAITTDATGGLWLALTGWDPGPGDDSVGRILRYSQGKWFDYRDRSKIPAYRCRVAYTDVRGRVWLGFEDGEVVEYADGDFRRFTSADGLPGGRVLAIASDRAGRILIGGEGGLSRFAAGRFATITKKNGLPGSSLSAIVEDEEGFVWLAGALGILRVSEAELGRAFDDSSYLVRGVSFDASDGLRGLPRQREPLPTAARAADGRIWFATTGGIAVIDPRRWPTNAVPPPVLIEEVVADDRELRTASGMELPPNTRNLRLRFTALSLTVPERVRFRYRLDGYDDDWHGPVGARTVTYTNLPPRSYRFRVVACNNDGLWNDAGAALSFAILPAFHQTRVFQALLLAAIGALA
ncbi:MAG TPA: two-component regulator propeller domain-containing protein [Thermoanaerobaculia bacterium]|nr:two-component regulator propeller domain-containing protein [Thermoanaerobaculia bacterium]